MKNNLALSFLLSFLAISFLRDSAFNRLCFSLCLCGENCNCISAVAIREPSAENAPIQRLAPSHPPT